MAKEQEEKKKKIPAWATRLPFGLCKRYGITLPDNATPRDAWNALKGRGISRREVYEKISGKEKPTGSGNKGVKEEQTKESGKTVEDLVASNRIKLSRKADKQGLTNLLNEGDEEVKDTTVKLFFDDSFGYDTKGRGYENFSPNDNHVHCRYVSVGDDPLKQATSSAVYHESWHAIDFNYGGIDQKEAYEYINRRKSEIIEEQGLPGYIKWISSGERQHEYAQKTRLTHTYVASNGKTFMETLLDETKGKGAKWATEIQERYSADRAAFIKENGEEGRKRAINKWSDMGDILNGLTRGKVFVCAGHARGYWDKFGDARAAEAFAEIASAKATSPESYAILKEYIPNTVLTFEEIYGKLKSGGIKARRVE